MGDNIKQEEGQGEIARTEHMTEQQQELQMFLNPNMQYHLGVMDQSGLQHLDQSHVQQLDPNGNLHNNGVIEGENSDPHNLVNFGHQMLGSEPQSPNSGQNLSGSNDVNSDNSGGGQTPRGLARRKPYVITKQREKWTDDEHQKFLDAIQIHNRDWKKVYEIVQTKTVAQIRSHAQKYFQKVQKTVGNSGASPEVQIPPPRTKRKSAGSSNTSTSHSAQDIQQRQQQIAQQMHTNVATYLATVSQWNTLGLTASLVNVPILNNSTDQGQRLSRELQDHVTKHLVSAEKADLDNAPVDPSFGKIYAYLGSLLDHQKYNHGALAHALTASEKEILKILLHNLSITLSNNQFREDFQLLVNTEAQKYAPSAVKIAHIAQALAQKLNDIAHMHDHMPPETKAQFLPQRSELQMQAVEEEMKLLTPEQKVQLQQQLYQLQAQQQQLEQIQQIQQLTSEQIIQAQQQMTPDQFAALWTHLTPEQQHNYQQFIVQQQNLANSGQRNHGEQEASHSAQ